MKPLLEARGLSVCWQPGEWLLRDVDLTLFPGELSALVGPSGCGKSTLCLALAGIVPRQLPGQVAGKILLAGQDLGGLSLPQVASNLGILFQDPQSQLFLPWVRRELAFGPENLCLPQAEIRLRLEGMAARLGIEKLLAANPNQLSGGEQQLVALAAVLALAPKILILDEVSAQLDPDTRRRILAILAELLAEGLAVLMVEHDLQQLALARHIYLLKEENLSEIDPSDLAGEENLLRTYGGGNFEPPS